MYLGLLATDAKLHTDDLALARACAEGDEAAWDRFIRTFRPILYRSADALDPSGGARELADGLYAELFGMRERDGERQSLFRYYHGRSSLATWLRAVLSQRFVDRIRATRRVEPLPEDAEAAPMSDPAADAIDPASARHTELMQQALARAVANLESRDRLRFACYYAQDLTLAQTGKLLGEHEATCSRQLARTRKSLRSDIETQLRAAGLDDRTIAECAATLSDDAGTLDIKELLGPRKESPVDRSK